MSKKPYNIAVIVKALNSDFWQTMLNGAKKAAEEHPELLKVTTYGPPEETDVALQVEILQQVVKEAPDGIAIASTSNDLTIPAIDEAMSKGIPVVTMDNQISSDNYVSFLATDSVNAAAGAADAMLADWKAAGIDPQGKKFLVINSSKASKVDQDRDRGFMERMKALVPSMVMLDVQYVENDPVLTENVTKTLIQANPDLIGIFADNDMTGVGISKGIAAAGAAGKVMGYAFDANDVEIQAVKDGVLTGMVVQDPFGIGHKSAMFAVDALENRQVPKAVDTGATIVTKANIDDPKVHKLLYPNQ